MEEEASVDFPIPNETIEIVTTYLTVEDLLALAAFSTERLKNCAFGVLHKKLKGINMFMGMLKLCLIKYRNQCSTNVSIPLNF